jgi:4-hydroxy-3-polyprenylbenzoate decarboxylase
MEVQLFLENSVMRLVVGICGASGVIYGVRLLEVLKEMQEVETHLVMTNAAKRVIGLELDKSVQEVKDLATCCHDEENIAASIASGSFKTEGMVIVPCSMKTLSAVACAFSDNLLVRAADVTLKEKRQLVIVPRETPLHSIHLEHMLKLSRMGATVMVPAPAFYYEPRTIDDLVNFIVDRILNVFGLECGLFKRWSGC